MWRGRPLARGDDHMHKEQGGGQQRAELQDEMRHAGDSSTMRRLPVRLAATARAAQAPRA